MTNQQIKFVSPCVKSRYSGITQSEFSTDEKSISPFNTKSITDSNNYNEEANSSKAWSPKLGFGGI